MDDDDEDQLPPFGVCPSSYCHLDKDVWGGGGLPLDLGTTTGVHWHTETRGSGACTLENI